MLIVVYACAMIALLHAALLVSTNRLSLVGRFVTPVMNFSVQNVVAKLFLMGVVV
jgi:hypothetical protein